jgi:repressor LexA
LTWPAQELLSHLGDPTGPGNHNESTGIPLCGKIAAGIPLEAVENIERLSLTGCFGTGELFGLEVKGDSMVNEDIRQGDYVICRRTDVAENGQLVIAIVDGENATLKRFYREEGQARLQPANDNYEPIYSTNCRIAAVVVGLLRRL